MDEQRLRAKWDWENDYWKDGQQSSSQYLRPPQSSTDSIRRTFGRDYGQCIPEAQLEDFEHCAQDFVDQLEKIKESLAGFDGWTRKAPRILPMNA